MQLPRSEGADWALGDGEERNRESPRRFFIPPRHVRESLRVEDVVKLLFVLTRGDAGRPNAERMWVKVTEITPTGYIGILGNRPSAIRDLATGDRIEFESRHVISILDESWGEYANEVAFVNRRLLENEELEPGFVAHEPADLELKPRRGDGARASGWQLLVGDETDAELANKENIRAPNLGWLMERYPTFGQLVLSGVTGGSWRLSADRTRYEPD